MVFSSGTALTSITIWMIWQLCRDTSWVDPRKHLSKFKYTLWSTLWYPRRKTGGLWLIGWSHCEPEPSGVSNKEPVPHFFHSCVTLKTFDYIMMLRTMSAGLTWDKGFDCIPDLINFALLGGYHHRLWTGTMVIFYILKLVMKPDILDFLLQLTAVFNFFICPCTNMLYIYSQTSRIW